MDIRNIYNKSYPDADIEFNKLNMGLTLFNTIHLSLSTGQYFPEQIHWLCFLTIQVNTSGDLLAPQPYSTPQKDARTKFTGKVKK